MISSLSRHSGTNVVVICLHHIMPGTALFLLLFVPPLQASNLQVVHLHEKNKYVQILKEPPNENSPISVCFRIFPHRIKDDVIPLISVKLDTLDKESGFDPDTNRFLEVWMITLAGRMKNGDKPFQIQTVHYNYKNNGYMGLEIEKFPYRWYNLCFSFRKTGQGLGEQIYYADGVNVFHGKNKSISDKFPWLPGNKMQVRMKNLVF